MLPGLFVISLGICFLLILLSLKILVKSNVLFLNSVKNEIKPMLAVKAFLEYLYEKKINK